MYNVKFKNNQVYFIDIRKNSEGIKTSGIIEKINSELSKILNNNFDINNPANAILKTHIGEPSNDTHIIPDILKTQIEFLKNKNVDTIAYGDTTVAYSGERGYKENPENNTDRYHALVKKNGFNDAPFVVLDRPVTSIEGFKFDKVHHKLEIDSNKIRYKKVFPSGGFLNADLILNNAHLTGHLIAKNALCNKSIAMGLGSYAAKIQLHQNLYPEIDNETCTLCKKCIESCPVSALSMEKHVKVDKGVCIGCGQCAAVCPVNAIEMGSNGITDWNKGTDSLDVRMSEYTIALLANYNGDMINIGHLYTITGMCDCMDVHQKPNCNDIGITVGYNPFAVDFVSTTLEGLIKSGDKTTYKPGDLVEFSKKSSRYEMYEYVKNNFGVEYIPEITRIEI